MLLFATLISGPDSDAFLTKVESISASLGYNPNWLMAVMHSETGGKYTANVRNPISGATGLIQFMPSTATWLGTSTIALAAMSRTTQLDYVYKYYQRWQQAGKVAKSYTDLYMITFYPYAVGKPDSFILGSEVSETRARSIAAQNNFDYDKDGYISVADFKQFVFRKYIMNYVPENMMYLLSSPAGTVAGVSISIGILAIGSFLIYKLIRR
jgi:hypothetical protein